PMPFRRPRDGAASPRLPTRPVATVASWRAVPLRGRGHRVRQDERDGCRGAYLGWPDREKAYPTSPVWLTTDGREGSQDGRRGRAAASGRTLPPAALATRAPEPSENAVGRCSPPVGQA